MKYIVRQTEEFALWHKALRDVQARAAVTRRLERAANGNLGDVKSVREGVSEMRIDVGKGYRLYFATRGRVMIMLLYGGDKATQQADIKCALRLIQEYQI